MDANTHTWAIVLAGGEGVRLRSLTTDSNGQATPKQYCSLLGASSLMQDALRRGQNIVGPDRLCAVVSDSHTRWWRDALYSLPPANIVCQPRNRGTGIGILLSVLWIVRQDPAARLVFLPADHFVEDEHRFGGAIQSAVDELAGAREDIVLLGIEPREADSELGYILCGNRIGRARRVARFVEKPHPGLAQDLVSRGALWNTFIFAATGVALLGHFRSRLPRIVDEMESAVARAQMNSPDRDGLIDLYRSLPEIDFSRDIVAAVPTRLRAIASPDCGWSDLGTPARVIEALRRSGSDGMAAMPRAPLAEDLVCLAASLSRLQSHSQSLFPPAA